jgi:hypothetical protein
MNVVGVAEYGLKFRGALVTQVTQPVFDLLFETSDGLPAAELARVLHEAETHPAWMADLGDRHVHVTVADDARGWQVVEGL